jgi:light-regulated signal transduction histidine kinase (bacteriophytochrome)
MNPVNRDLSSVLSRITNKLQQDQIVSDALHRLREQLDVDRVVLYYFYKQWKGQVTFESISEKKYSIIGSMYINLNVLFTLSIYLCFLIY